MIGNVKKKLSIILLYFFLSKSTLDCIQCMYLSWTNFFIGFKDKKLEWRYNRITSLVSVPLMIHLPSVSRAPLRVSPSGCWGSVWPRGPATGSPTAPGWYPATTALGQQHPVDTLQQQQRVNSNRLIPCINSTGSTLPTWYPATTAPGQQHAVDRYPATTSLGQQHPVDILQQHHWVNSTRLIPCNNSTGSKAPGW